MNTNCRVEYIPAKPSIKLSEIVYYYMITLVPFGRLTRYEDICNFIAKKFNVGNVEFERPFNLNNEYWYKFIDNVPFHRVVSAYGYTSHNFIDKLIDENFIFEQTNESNRGPKVKDYKKYLFDFEKEAQINTEILNRINNDKDFEIV